MAVATRNDVETSLMRQLTESESQYVDALLDRAEQRILARVPDFEERLSNEAFKGTVISITADAVARVFRNPDGYTQETEGNYGYSLNFRVASGLLDILDDEWTRLGVGGLNSQALQMDGYARARYRGRPDLVFQFGWPGDQPGMSEEIAP